MRGFAVSLKVAVFAGEKGSGDALMGRYRAFAGLVFQSKDFTRYEEKTVDECKKFCDTGATHPD